MKNNKRYILYGFIGILIIATSYWGFNFLKGSALFKKTNTYFVYYERIEGLNESSPVTVNGYKVGKVSKITFLPQKDCNLLIQIEISNDFLLPDSTVARIYSMDLMGSKGIELQFGSKSTYHSPGDTLFGDIEQSLKDQVSIQMLPVKKQAEDLMAELTKAITIIRYIFNDETRANLEKSFESIKTTLFYLEGSAMSLDTWLKSESGKIARILENVEYLTRTLSNNSEQLSNIFDNLSTFSDTLAALEISKTVIEANQAIANFNMIMEKINSGEGSIGQLMNDNKLATELEKSATNLKNLLFDLQYNPKKYVNFSLMNIGRTVNVGTDSELTDRDKKVFEKQKEKEAKEAQKNYEKEQKRKSKNPDNDDTSLLQEGEYMLMIQIRSATAKIEPNSDELKGYSDVIECKVGGLYKYLIFPHDNSNQTSYYLSLAQEDFPDAFPVGYNGISTANYHSTLSYIAHK